MKLTLRRSKEHLDVGIKNTSLKIESSNAKILLDKNIMNTPIQTGEGFEYTLNFSFQ